MSVTLSAADFDSLKHAQTVLLSPLDYPTCDAWRAVASARIARLLGADQAVFTLPRTTRGAALNYERDHLFRATRGATEICADWALRNELPDPEEVGFDPLPGELFAYLHVNREHDQWPVDDESNDAFGTRGLTLLQVLLPAFKAGIRTHLAVVAHAEALAEMLDRLPDGAAVWDPAGHCRYQNRALVDLLAADAERARIERTLADLARRLLVRHGAALRTSAVMASDLSLMTAANRYRLRATYAAALGHTAPPVLVLVQPARRLPSPELLRARYRLTPRQIEVAQRLATGQSDSAIACALGISRRTAEHHTEAVRLSLGVCSRAALAAALQQSC